MDLDGRVVLVTGASRGVGAAIAVAVAEAGADVALAARTTATNTSPHAGTLEDTVERVNALGRRAVAVPTNLAVEEEVVAMVDRVVDEFGRVDVLVNNAAVAATSDLSLDRKRFDLLFNVNTRAPMVAMREAARDMALRGEGSILNISSAAASRSIPGLMVYGMSKIALEHLTVLAADQLQPLGIAVNCFRIDIATGSEGLLSRNPDTDEDQYEPTSVAAEGVLWMLRQPPDYTRHLVSMTALRDHEGIMASRARGDVIPTPGLPIVPGFESTL